MRAHGYSSAEAAEPFDLPPAAVLEAVDCCQRHKDLVDAETAEEGRRLCAGRHPRIRASLEPDVGSRASVCSQPHRHTRAFVFSLGACPRIILR